MSTTPFSVSSWHKDKAHVSIGMSFGQVQCPLKAEALAKEGVKATTLEDSLFKLSALGVNRISKKRPFSEITNPFEPDIPAKRVCNVHISASTTESSLFKFSKGVKTRACQPSLYEIYEPHHLFNITTRSSFHGKKLAD